MATAAPDQLTDLFGPRSSIPVNTTTPSAIRGISRLKRINIPKKKPTNTKICSSVDMMEDISSTIKDNQEDNVYECPFCFEKLKAPYPEELEKAIKEVKEKQRAYKEEQKKAYETKVAKERAEGFGRYHHGSNGERLAYGSKKDSGENRFKQVKGYNRIDQSFPKCPAWLLWYERCRCDDKDTESVISGQRIEQEDMLAVEADRIHPESISA
ncbi:hypothetical protein RO3G_03304 [Rhizopus delemar RA 99-880]|uniref:Uncharacterized protein n=1 Tax=Rhizopus delemar (strain RA 99-880 / ATCC MYA-4621 / FGSC 9543 / NRRL 43880) TaxID=246409 RepID=I1BQX0_RHIO9|nr:hypothetical protein RO3G_03304 [Rhizopus delemar RA 99-880]|eukprot:EIE78600.1 hypothetical protein RO3G_03304 [Rhizopus delemar RA 99-880]